eukprot:CAMPEP_0119313484 /NCGR_PEP_ID=MMETSP1333-20130426/29254_1 /TAXON_ID=418940 /ORGANISM="Scyphosphaera apsteinii, Strain RCC1455" /LENGTH=145 /DNA_ID=CAMNT_0007318329 /DNA_START=72 /DNA_END=509 /DNA_ORIENTATION=-
MTTMHLILPSSSAAKQAKQALKSATKLSIDKQAAAPESKLSKVPPFLRKKLKSLVPQVQLHEISGGPRPFHIMRSQMGKLPVYTDIRNGRSKLVTILRKYSGDIDALKTELESVTGTKAVAYHGRLEVSGRHTKLLNDWLTKLGF